MSRQTRRQGIEPRISRMTRMRQRRPEAQGEMVTYNVLQRVRDDLFARFLSVFSAAALFASVCFLFLCSRSAIADYDPDKLFKDSIRPLFERKCFECHSSKADEVKGNLKLESLESILKGGDQGPAIVAGDIKDSFLLRAIRYQVEDFQMPPAGRLSDDDIALVEKWVKSLGSAK